MGALSGLVCVPTQHLQATIGESSVSRHLHTRIAARVCETSGRAAENRATLEPTKHVAKQSSWDRIPLGALSGLVCVPTQHLQATIGESSVSRHLHTRIAARVCETSGRAAENRATLEPTKHVAKQSSWCQIPLGALSGLVCVPTQHLQATIGESSVSRHLHTRIAARVCETSGRAAENRATLEPTKHVAKQSSWDQIPLGALSGLVCVPTQHLQATIGESSVSRHLHTRIAARVCETSGRAAENRATLEPTKHVAKQSSW